MNNPNNPTMNMNMNNGNMMEMLKSNLMTMMMFKSINNNNSEKGSNIFDMVYIFLLTQVIDFVFKHLPTIVSKVKKYSENNFKTHAFLDNIVNTNNLEKKELSSSIHIQINIADHENIYGQALLDFITNNNNTKHISFKKGNFILNQNDIIEILDEIFIRLKESKLLGEVDNSKADVEQIVELFSYTKTTHELREFLNKISHDYNIKIKNKLDDKLFYFNLHPQNAPTTLDGKKDYMKLPNNCIFTMKMFQTNRKFSNLFGPEISVVKKRVEFFIKNKKWYDKKGIPYTLGLLLSGQAGSGKTSSIKCLANETHRHIINVNLNNDITKIQLENLFFNEMIMVLNVSTGQNEKYFIPLDQRIYVLEDIDCQSDIVKEREVVNKDLPAHLTPTEKIDLSFLLNLLDGVLEIPGRIVVMTSNYPENLDHALIRPGRIDVIADFKKCSRITIIEMMEFFYDIELNSEEKEIITSLQDYIVSPAELGKLMFENIYTYSICIEKLVLLNKNVFEKRDVSLNKNTNKKVDTNETKKINDFNSTDTTCIDNLENNFDLLDVKSNIKLYPYNDPSNISTFNNRDFTFATEKMKYKNNAYKYLLEKQGENGVCINLDVE